MNTKFPDTGVSTFTTGDSPYVTSTVTIGSQPRQAPGFCEEHNLEHAWADGPMLTSWPGISTRCCVNCGKRQHLRHVIPQWEDVG